MVVWYNQILLSFIFILSTAIFSQVYFKSIKNENLWSEFERWKGTIENYIKFKGYQYNQIFLLVYGMMPIIIFSLVLFFGAEDSTIKIIGELPFLTLIFCILYFLIKFFSYLSNANNLAINHMKVLLNNKNARQH